MVKAPEEWLKQADYDMDTAWALLEIGRNFYAVFFCHLAIEKALKALYVARQNEEPPKTHSLTYLVQLTKTGLPETHGDCLSLLDGLSVPTRYPHELDMMLRDYDEARTREVLQNAKEALRWLRTQL